MRRSGDTVFNKKRRPAGKNRFHQSKDGPVTARKFSRHRSPATTESANNAPSQSREVKQLLEGIGTPNTKAFKPDPFQVEALAALGFEDVLVAAPTGSG